MYYAAFVTTLTLMLRNTRLLFEIGHVLSCLRIHCRLILLKEHRHSILRSQVCPLCFREYVVLRSPVLSQAFATS